MIPQGLIADWVLRQRQSLNPSILHSQPKQSAAAHSRRPQSHTSLNEVVPPVQSQHLARDVASSAMFMPAPCHLLLVPLCWGKPGIDIYTSIHKVVSHLGIAQ